MGQGEGRIRANGARLENPPFIWFERQLLDGKAQRWGPEPADVCLNSLAPKIWQHGGYMVSKSKKASRDDWP